MSNILNNKDAPSLWIIKNWSSLLLQQVKTVLDFLSIDVVFQIEY